MKKNLIILSFLSVSFLFSCNQNTLYFNKETSNILDESINYINKFTTEYSKDSIIINRFWDDIVKKNTYYIQNENVYSFLKPMILEHSEDTVLFLSKNDTSFIWKQIEEMPFIIGLNLSSSKIKIERKNDFCITELRSLIDTSYIEKYYYDLNYKIFQIEYHYKSNSYIYN